MTLLPTPLRVAMVAGEPSGDLLAASLLDGLRERLPAGTKFTGIGGPRMTATGFDAHWPMDKLTVRGYVEALKHIPEILGIRNELKRQLLAEPPSVFVGVDAPDFNFGLEHALREAGIPTVHFVCPSIWAWRGGRIKKIAKAVDHMLCVFPFEPELMEKAGIAATYVGHPLADEIPIVPDVAGARRTLELPEGGPIIAVLPGSRRSEIALIGPTFFDAMELMQRREPGVRLPRRGRRLVRRPEPAWDDSPMPWRPLRAAAGQPTISAGDNSVDRTSPLRAANARPKRGRASGL